MFGRFPPKMAEKIGDMLLKCGLITEQQLQEALQLQKTNGGKIGFNLIKLGFVKEEDITSLLSEQYGVPAIHLEHFEIDESILKHIPPDVAQKYILIPIERTGATLTVAMADPSNVFALDDVRFITGYQVEPVVAAEASIREEIGRYYGSSHDIQLKEVMDEISREEVADLEVEDDESEVSAEDLEAASQDAPVVKLCNLV